jgi:hypothetical protein
VSIRSIRKAYPDTPEQKLALENRRDVIGRRNKLGVLQKCGSKSDISRAKDLLEDLRQRRYVLVLTESPNTYFAEAARLRARGLLATHLRSSTLPPCSDHAVLDINSLVALFTGHSISNIGKPAKELVFAEGAEERSEKAIAWLLSYTAKAWTLLSAAGSPAPEMTEEKPATRPTCFICMSNFDRRGKT